MVGERITKPSRRRGLLAVLGGLCFAKSVDGFWLGAAPGRVWDGPSSRPLCPAVSGATWAQPRPIFSTDASPAGLQSVCYAKKRGSPEGERAKKGGRGRKKEEEVVRDHDDDDEVLEFGAYEGGLDFDDGADYDDGNDEGYVFDPSDFPMLDGEEDLFGDYEDEEESAAVEKLRRAEEGEGGGEGQQEGTRKRKAKLPVLAVIGRPNVGKSTIVNRICKTLSNEPKAIVYDYEGVTRDRIYRRAEWDERLFEVVDTGGLIFDENAEDVFAPQIREQALLALDESVASIFVVDGQTGPTTLDEEIARFLRMRKKPVIVAVNKCENPTMAEAWAAMFYSLGLGKPYAVSGLHGTGIAEVLEKLKPHIYQVDEVDDDTAFNVAIVGRPNVGKSSLLNRLYGKERAIVSDVAGTTRDAIDAMVTHEGQEYRFIDTAGIRRRKKVEHGNEFLMVNRALKAIRRADVVLLVIDVVAGISDQDKILAQRIADDGRACVIIANKWDAVEKDEKTFNEAVKYVKEELYAVNWAEVIFTSALTGQRVNKIYDAVNRAVKTHRQRVRTSLLNEVLSDALMWQKPPAVKASQIGRIYYCNQVSVEPPTMVVFCNNPKLFPESYKRYLDRKFRESLDFKGTPIRWNFRGKKMRQLNRGQKNSTPVPYGSP